MNINKRKRHYLCWFSLIINDKVIQTGNILAIQIDCAEAFKAENPSDKVEITINGSHGGDWYQDKVVFTA